MSTGNRLLQQLVPRARTGAARAAPAHPPPPARRRDGADVGPVPRGVRARSVCVRPYLAVAPAFLVALGVCSLVYSGAIAASASSANFRCEASSCSAKS